MLLLAHLDLAPAVVLTRLMERLSHQRQKKKMSALSVTQRDLGGPGPDSEGQERELACA